MAYVYFSPSNSCIEMWLEWESESNNMTLDMVSDFVSRPLIMGTQSILMQTEPCDDREGLF